MILITGVDGYIGSHMAYRLATLKRKFIGIDRYAHKNMQVLETFNDMGVLMIGNCMDLVTLSKIIARFKVKTVIHFAADKSISASYDQPDYLHNNVSSTVTLIKAMKECGADKIIFSSSASVYGDLILGTKPGAVDEDHVINPKNPYSLSKVICEQLVQASGLEYVILRYFNPIGEMHGLKDYAPDGIQHALRQDTFVIHGNDYPTPDGTAIRDFIPISQLIDAHMFALNWKNEIVNVGTGSGTSVKQICDERKIKYTYGPRREGDIAAIWADTTKYQQLVKTL